MLDDLNKRFEYRAERTDSWTIMDNETGPLRGDCDDYALTAMWYLSGKSRKWLLWNMITMRYFLVRCYHNGNGHLILYDPKSGCYIDNIMKRWVKDLPNRYEIRYRLWTPHNVFRWFKKGFVAKYI